MKKSGFIALGCVTLGALVGVQAQATPQPPRVSNAYLLSEFKTSPVGPTGAPFTLTGTNGVALLLNGSGVATNALSLSGPVVAQVGFAFSYLSNTATINPGEGFAQNSAAMAARVDKEIGTLDDVGLFQEGATDAPLNLDFTDCGAKVKLKKFECDLTRIVIAEDAGLDPFELQYSTTANFASVITLFNGFNTFTKNKVLNRPDFGSNDSGLDIDQIYVFEFAKPLAPGYLRLKETGNYGGTALEIDFAGAACVPEPNVMVLVTGGLSLLGMVARRRK